MHTNKLRVKRVHALQNIGDYLGIDFDAIPRQIDDEHKQLAILERVECALQGGTLMTPEQFLDEIEDIPGIGDGTITKIREGLQ